MYAQILWIGANVLWARTFHGRKHFMGANISWAQTFHGREYFRGANILMQANILGYAQIFQDVRIYLIGNEYFDMHRYFEDERIHFRLGVNV